MASFLKTTLAAAALSLGAGAAQAQGVPYGYDGYGPAPAYSGDYGYAGSAIRGDYVGAPLTRFPRPSEIVPSAWGYGTYGIPTVAGIRQAPVGTPTVYVIDAPAPAMDRRSGAVRPRILSRGRAGHWSQARGLQGQGYQGQGFHQQAAPQQAGGARVVTVSVPRPQASIR